MNKSELLKTAKPILFSTEMVRAILDGKKTQTRRVIKINGYPITSPKESLELTKEGLIYHSFCSMSGYYKLPCQPGDILWVRETWYKNYPHEYGRYWYRADGEEIDMPTIYGGTVIYGKADGLKWRPSIHMPKEAARIFLRVKNVRVERLQDITSHDAVREGCKHTMLDGIMFISSIGEFHALWDSLNAKRGFGWDTNPWVWVIEFERIEVEG